MLDEIRELNETFYELYGRLYENKLFLPQKQIDVINQVLLAEYKAEYAWISSENEIERSSENFSVKLRKKALVPKRWWLFGRKNRAAQLIEDEVRAAIEAYFAAKEAEIAETVRKTQTATTETPAEQAQDDGTEEAEQAAETDENGVAEAAETPAEQAQGAEANDGKEEAREAAETTENGAAGAAIPF